MTYNISKRTIHRMHSHLESMHLLRTTITWPSREPEQLARRIREAIFAAQHHPEYERFARLKPLYTIHARAGFVEAEWLGVEEGVVQEVAAIPTVPQTLTFPDVFDLEGIVGTALSHYVEGNELHFPEAILSEEQKYILWKWTKESETEWKFIDQDDAGVTLTRKPVDDILLWRPE